MSTNDAPAKPNLRELGDMAAKALEDIQIASDQYRQAKLLFQDLVKGGSADGLLYYQPNAGGTPVQLPAPNAELLSTLLDAASVKLQAAVRAHWLTLVESGQAALEILDGAAAAQRAAIAAQFEEAGEVEAFTDPADAPA